MSELAVEKTKKPKRWNLLAALSATVAATTWCVINPGLVEAHTQQLLGRETGQERLISDVASKIYGKQIFVHCSDKTGPLYVQEQNRAYAITPMLPIVGSLGVIIMRPDLCDSLSQFAADPQSNHPLALHALAHELSHLMGKDGQTLEWREDVADCYGTQRVPEVAEAFGAGPSVALAIGEYSASIQENYSGGYNTTGACFDGGQYDLDPNNPGVFPPSQP